MLSKKHFAQRDRMTLIIFFVELFLGMKGDSPHEHARPPPSKQEATTSLSVFTNENVDCGISIIKIEFRLCMRISVFSLRPLLFIPLTYSALRGCPDSYIDFSLLL